MTKTSPLFFSALFLSLFLAIFYNTVTNMAGVYIVSDLGGSRETSVYAMVFFGLGNVLSIPLATPLGERLGWMKLLVYGLLAYTVFSILCGLASTFFVFNVFRLGLGFASGLFYILCRKLIVTFSPPEKLETYSFIMILHYAIVPVLGACFGAWVAYESHWHWIFHINESIALLLAFYFWFFHKKLDSPTEKLPAFDKTGYIFFVIGMGSLVTAATLSQELDWFRSPLFNLLLLMGIPSLLFFILWELDHPAPLLNLKLLRSSLLSYSLLNLAILFSAYFGMIILVTLWLNIYANYTPAWISALLGTMGVAGVLAYFVSKDLLRRFDPRFTLALSILAFAGSCYYSTHFNVEVDFFHLAVARFLSGLGLVLFLQPILNLAFASYGSEKSSDVFALFQIVRSLSGGLGAVLYVILWQRRQIFFHERLGEGLTPFSQLTADYFNGAIEKFHLTKEQAAEQLNVFLDQYSTSLGLNDAFGAMGHILIGLLVFLAISFAFQKNLVPHK